MAMYSLQGMIRSDSYRLLVCSLLGIAWATWLFYFGNSTIDAVWHGVLVFGGSYLLAKSDMGRAFVNRLGTLLSGGEPKVATDNNPLGNNGPKG
jgi:hypothetical protein